MCKKVISMLLAFSLLTLPVCGVSAQSSNKVKNLYRICALTGAISWLTWAGGLSLEKNLLKAPLKKPGYSALASLFSVLAVYEFVEFIHLIKS